MAYAKTGVLACLLILAACGGGGGGGGGSAPPPPTSAPASPATDPTAIPDAVSFPARASDLEWSERHQLLYLSLPAVNGLAGNSVVALDPRTNRVAHRRDSCSEPAELALSDDGQYLHVACNGSGSVERYRLPELTLDGAFFLGRDLDRFPFRVSDMLPVPGQPRSVVVSLHVDPYVPVPWAVRVYDDGTPRPADLSNGGAINCWSMAWDRARSRLLCGGTATTAFALQEAFVTPDGLRAGREARDAFRYFYARMSVDPTTDIVYGDDGSVFDAAAWRPLPRRDNRGPVAPDAARNRIYYVSSDGVVRSLNATTLEPTTSAGPGSRQATRLIRWGANGLALATAERNTIVHGGSGVASIDTTIPRGTASQRALALEPQRMVWDPVNAVLYATVGSGAARHADSVVVIDPFTGTIAGSRMVGPQPGALAVSGDGRYLYVAIDGEGAVRRLRLPGLETDLSFTLGADAFFGLRYTAAVLRVHPARPGTVAVTRALPEIRPTQIGGVLIYDDGVARPAVAQADPLTLQRIAYFDMVWNADGSQLHAIDEWSDLFHLDVSATGLTVGSRLGTVSSVRSALRFDAVNGQLSIDGGNVVRLPGGQPVGTYRPFYNIGSQYVALDPGGADAFTLAPSQNDGFKLEITTYDARRFVPKKVHAVDGDASSVTLDFVLLRPGWFAWRSFNAVHVVQLRP